MKKKIEINEKDRRIEIFFRQGLLGKVMYFVKVRIDVYIKEKNKGFKEYDSLENYFNFRMDCETGKIIWGVVSLNVDENLVELARKEWIKLIKKEEVKK